MYNILMKLILGCALIFSIRPDQFVATENLQDGLKEDLTNDHEALASQTDQQPQPPDASENPELELSHSIETQLSPPPVEKVVVIDSDQDSSAEGGVHHHDGINNDDGIPDVVDETDDKSHTIADENGDNVHDLKDTVNDGVNGETSVTGDESHLDKGTDHDATPSHHEDPVLAVQKEYRQQQQQQQQQQHLHHQQQHGQDTQHVVPSGDGAGVSGEDGHNSAPPTDSASSVPNNVINTTVADLVTDGLPLPPTTSSSASSSILSAAGSVVSTDSAEGAMEEMTQADMGKEELVGLDGPQVFFPSQVDSSSQDPILEMAASATTDLPNGIGGMAVKSSIDSGFEKDLTRRQHQQGVTEGVGAVEEGKKKGAEEDFPTFDKWSVQYLAEQERQKVEKEMEMEQTTDPVVGQKLKKLRLNFASKLCGAKVVASNPEAENTDKVLTNNPDEYMISPCKAKKWFVVELCEPLQVHLVELGTVELFSSPPKSFQVFASQRYPTKEWSPLGRFEMTSKRSVQSFQTTVTADEYVKYIKVELMEHHGEEHYCPITAFRVLGLDMASDDEEEGMYSQEERGDEEVTEEEEEASVSLFEKTKDTVVKLVQKVLYTGDSGNGDKKAEDKVDDSLKENQNSFDNATEASSAEGQNATEPTTGGPSADYPTPGRVNERKVKDDGQDFQQPEPVVDEEHHKEPPVKEPEPKEIPIITKLTETEQLPTENKEIPMVVKLDGDESSDEKIKGSRRYRRRRMKCTSWQTRDQLSYFGLLKRDSNYFCTSDNAKATPRVRTRLTESGSVSSDNVEKKGDAKSVTSDKGTESVVQTTVADLPNQGSTLQTPGSDVGNLGDDDEKTDDAALKNKEDSADMNGQQPQDGKQASSSQTTQFISSDVSTPTTEVLEPSSLSPEGHLTGKAASVITPVLDIEQSRVKVNDMGSDGVTKTVFLKVNPSPTTSSLEVDDNTVLLETATTSSKTATGGIQDNNKQAKDPRSSSTNGDDIQPSSSRATNKVNATGNGQGNGNVKPSPSLSTPPVNGRVVGSGNGGGRQPVDLVKVPLSSGAKRDASVMKINNRIVALEQNVSMAKRYLEELSRAFKQQNEDMMTLINKTMGKFQTHETWAEERDLRQQTELDLLDQRLLNLTYVVSSMSQQMDVMGQELHNKQLILSMIQVILFLWLTISSFRGRGKRSDDAITDHKFLLDTMPSQPQVPMVVEGGESADSGSVMVRRNSDVGITVSALDASPLKRQSSDTNIAMSLSSSPKASPGMSRACPDAGGLDRGASQTSKKKKKKKLKALQQQQHKEFEAPTTATIGLRSMSTSSTLSPLSSSSSPKPPSQTPSFSSQAGVLFGAHIDTKSSITPAPATVTNKNSESVGGKKSNKSLSSSSSSSSASSSSSSLSRNVSSGHSSRFSSSGALKENLPLLSLGIVHNVDTRQNAPSSCPVSEKRFMFPSSQECSAINRSKHSSI